MTIYQDHNTQAQVMLLIITVFLHWEVVFKILLDSNEYPLEYFSNSLVNVFCGQPVVEIFVETSERHGQKVFVKTSFLSLVARNETM